MKRADSSCCYWTMHAVNISSECTPKTMLSATWITKLQTRKSLSPPVYQTSNLPSSIPLPKAIYPSPQAPRPTTRPQPQPHAQESPNLTNPLYPLIPHTHLYHHLSSSSPTTTPRHRKPPSSPPPRRPAIHTPLNPQRPSAPLILRLNVRHARPNAVHRAV